MAEQQADPWAAFRVAAPVVDDPWQEFRVTAPAAPAKPLPVDPVVDTAKGVGVGAVKGGLGMLNIPEQGATLIHGATNAVERGLGLTPSPRPGTVAQNFADRWSPLDGAPEMQSKTGMTLPGAEDAQAGIEKHTGPFYKPQTYAGEWGETIGGYLPAAVGGPGGLVSRVGTQAILPALASEGAGHLTKGTAAEGPARMGAALMAGPAAGRAFAGRAAPTSEALKTAYGSVVDNPALRAMPVNTAGLSDRIVTALGREGFDPLNTPNAFQRAGHIDTYANPTAGDLINVRKKMGRDAQSTVATNPSSTVASDLAKRNVDDAISDISPEFRDANANYAAAKRSDLVQGKIEQAENRAGAANSGQNISNTQRQRMVDILNSDKLSRGFSPEEIDQLKRISGGTMVGNTGRYVGNLLGGGGGMGQFLTAAGLGGAGYAAGGTEGAGAGIALAGLGRLGKGVERASTNRQLGVLDNMIRSRAPLASTAGTPQISREDLIRALLREEGTRRSPDSPRSY